MSARRTRGQLRPLTLAERRKKAARNDRRGRARAYVQQPRRQGDAVAPHLPAEAISRKRERLLTHGDSAEPRRLARALAVALPWRRKIRRGGDR